MTANSPNAEHDSISCHHLCWKKMSSIQDINLNKIMEGNQKEIRRQPFKYCQKSSQSYSNINRAQGRYLTERYHCLSRGEFTLRLKRHSRFVFQSICRQVGSESQYWKSCQLPQQASYSHVNFDLFLELSYVYLAAQTDYQNLKGPGLCAKI